MRRRLQPAWVANVRISIPISADAKSLAEAQASLNKIIGVLPIGATAEVTNATFGKMEVAKGVPLVLTPIAAVTITNVGSDYIAQTTNLNGPALPIRASDPDVPTSLDRRVPRHVDN